VLLLAQLFADALLVMLCRLLKLPILGSWVCWWENGDASRRNDGRVIGVFGPLSY